jgi:filamentous hemagglutinin family protein
MSKCPASLIQFWFITTIGATIGAIVAGAQGAIAQVSNDPLGETSVSSSGNTWVIGAGSQRANSLFHNLIDFKIQSGITALFKVDPAFNPNVDRVVTYVRNAAEVNGNLRIVDQFLNLKTADLFLLSPNGITFGPSAFLDVRGALFVTTANRLTFDDGVVFENGWVSAASGFPTHKPIEFGFGGITGRINVNAAPFPVTNTPRDLSLGPNLTSLVLLGNEVEVNNRRINSPRDGLDIGAVSPDQVVGVSQQTSPGNQVLLSYPSSLDNLGLVEIKQAATIFGQNAVVDIVGRRITIEDSPRSNRDSIKTENGTVNLIAKDLQITGGKISSQTGAINLRTQNLQINFSDIYNANGAISLLATQSIDMTGNQISSQAGAINLSAQSIDASNNIIYNDSGSTNLLSTQAINLIGGQITSQAGSIDLSGQNINANGSTISNTNGNIDLTAKNIQLTGSTISNQVGNISLNAGSIQETGSSIRNQAGDIYLTAENIRAVRGQINSQDGDLIIDNNGLNTGSFIFRDLAIGDARDPQAPDIENRGTPGLGSISIVGNSIDVSAAGIGTKGDITVSGNQVNLSGLGIRSDSGAINLSGDTVAIDQYTIVSKSGNVSLSGRSISTSQGGFTTETGQVVVAATETVDLDRTGLKSSNGDIQVSAPQIDMQDIDLSAQGQGRIQLSGETITLSRGRLASDSGNINFSGNSFVLDSLLMKSETGNIQLDGSSISVSDSTIRNDTGNISLNSTGSIILDQEANVMTTGSGLIQLTSKNSITLKNGSAIDARQNGSVSLDSPLISLANGSISTSGSGSLSLLGGDTLLNQSAVSSTGSGKLNLSGKTLDLTASSINKSGLPAPGAFADFNLGEFGSIALRDSSKISALGRVNFTVITDRLTFEDFPASSISYTAPTRLLPKSKFPADFLGFSCNESGFCSITRTPVAQDPLPEPPAPRSPAKAVTSELPASPVEPASSPKAIAIPISGRDSSSQSALNLRCQGPIARQVLFQRSGRGGLLATPGASLATDVFQDFGGQGLGSSPRSAAPIASAVATPAMALEAQNWQVDSQGRISLLASAAVTSDRASQECPDPLTQ